MENFLVLFGLTGVAGFEPAHGGVKVHSLTAWRHPIRIFLKLLFNFCIY